MAIPMPNEGELPPGALRDFVLALHQIYDEAGQPAARIISRAIDRLLPSPVLESVSHETVLSALRGKSAPSSWKKVRSIVTVLVAMWEIPADPPQELPRMKALWIAARAGAPAPSAEELPVLTRDIVLPSTTAVPPAPRLPARTEFPRVDLPPPTTVREGAVVGALPAANEHFVDRGDLLVRMRATLRDEPRNPLVLYGTTGAGKTQLAGQFVRAYAGDYATVWWIPAGSRAAAEESLAELGGRIGAPGSSGDVKRRLSEQAGDHLLVFDGVDDPAVLDLIPTAGGHVIVTSRDPALGRAQSSNGIEVPGFSEAEARQFLTVRAGEITEDQADRLIAVLGRLPLALEQAVAAWSVAPAPWGMWLDRLASDGAALLAVGRPQHYPAPFGEILRSGLARLREVSASATGAAELFAALAPGSIPLSLFEKGLAGDAPDPELAVLRNSFQRGQIIRQLTQIGLIRLLDDERLEVEPVLRLLLRGVLSADALARAHRSAHALLAAADPGLPDDIASADLHREIAAHVRATGLVESPLRPARTTVYHQIRYRFLCGDYREACALAEDAVQRWSAETSLGRDDPLVLRATRQWANALRARGRYEQAWNLTSDGLSRLRSNPDYGDDHRQTLDMRSSHASDLRFAGEYQKALDTASDIYESYRNQRDADSRIAATRHNRAICHRLMAEFRVAEDLDRESWAENKRTRGDANWRTMLSVHALGEDLYGQGRYREVVDLLSGPAANNGREPEAFDLGVLLATRTLALARRGLGEVAAARAQLAEHYERCARLFGEDHDHTLSARMSLATTLLQEGDIDGAHRHAVAVNADYRLKLGPRNPLTLVSVVNLAAVLRQAGDLGQARTLDAVASEALRDVLGVWHPYTIAAMIGLSGDYAGTARPASAVQISARAYAAAKAARGEDHPDTLAAAAGQILDLSATGSAGAADSLRQQVLKQVREKLGPQHPMVTAIHEETRIECPAEPPSS
ncbi:MAG: FxSxx-COOH system tetratricopeptide repeat protein [Actinoplanes sp.]